VNVLARVEFKTAREIANLATQLYIDGKIDAVYIVFSEFKSVMAPNLALEKLLPIEKIEGETERDKDRKEAASDSQVDYIYEQPPEELFRVLLPKYVGIQIFRALMESVAAEHAARMTAMDAATNNATDMIDSLTLAMNRARQAKITKEIIEIVSGAAAM